MSSKKGVKPKRLGKTRICALLGGGDWYDASVTHLVIPASMDLAAEQKAYLPSRRSMTFAKWLVEHRGARWATAEDVIEFEEL